MSKRRFVVVESPDRCGVFCHGIFDDYRTAIGEAMESVWELEECYQDKGDYFSYTRFEGMDGEGGFVMEVKYKKACWDEVCTDYYYILFDDGDDEAA